MVVAGAGVEVTGFGVSSISGGGHDHPHLLTVLYGIHDNERELQSGSLAGADEVLLLPKVCGAFSTSHRSHDGVRRVWKVI